MLRRGKFTWSGEWRLADLFSMVRFWAPRNKREEAEGEEGIDTSKIIIFLSFSSPSPDWKCFTLTRFSKEKQHCKTHKIFSPKKYFTWNKRLQVKCTVFVGCLIMEEEWTEKSSVIVCYLVMNEDQHRVPFLAIIHQQNDHLCHENLCWAQLISQCRPPATLMREKSKPPACSPDFWLPHFACWNPRGGEQGTGQTMSRF